MANTIDRVKQNIRERLEELEAEREQLIRALEALSGSGSSVGRRGRPVEHAECLRRVQILPLPIADLQTPQAPSSD